jgi:prepilin-type N-terminal cleavage/methylation domain-containing protein/prepilin-type processing-associated H-X9-DG protein
MVKRAFTLVELLVVISIIAVLMAVIVPSLNRVRAQAKNADCQSNLRQYVIAEFMFVQDHDEYFTNPHYFLFKNWKNIDSPQCRWHNPEVGIYSDGEEPDGELWPYLQNKNVFCCKEFRLLAKRFGGAHPGHNPDIDIVPQYSYSQNAYTGCPWWGGVVKITQVRDTGRLFLFSEENVWVDPQRQCDLYTASALNDTILLVGGDIRDKNAAEDLRRARDNFATFHNVNKTGDLTSGRANACFVDGHVAPVKPSRQSFSLYAWPKAGILGDKKRIVTPSQW